jgi:hypothetical protein
MMRAAFVLTSIFALCLAGVPAEAQLARSFVSAEIGNDANAPNCNRTTPCRTFQTAHDNTLDKGEVTVLDPGSYGAVLIQKNISIINDGVGEAGILVSGGNIGINVNAPGASVSLRGLTIKGIGFGGGVGIRFATGSALNVENCTVRNLDGTGDGIEFNPNSPAALQVTNSIVSDNTASGIVVSAQGSNVNVVAALDHVGLYNNIGNGLFVNGVNATGTSTIMTTVLESVASNNGAGFFASSQTGAALARIMLVRSVASGNIGTGVASVGTNAQVLVDDSAVYGNRINGWLASSGGQLFSFGNNVVADNASNEGPQSPLALK